MRAGLSVRRRGVSGPRPLARFALRKPRMPRGRKTITLGTVKRAKWA